MSDRPDRIERIARAAVRIAVLAHHMDRPEWLGTAAAVLAFTEGIGPDRVRKILADPARVEEAARRLDPDGAAVLYGD
ncbi:MAG: hypothetical protein OXQ93_14425 [Gemmatimonadota bacterium]|nr:hypothetical protein [Gemmatimonadota bacterium]